MTAGGEKCRKGPLYSGERDFSPPAVPSTLIVVINPASLISISMPLDSEKSEKKVKFLSK